MPPQEGAQCAPVPANNAGGGTASNATGVQLPKCFCNWKSCRAYQKAFRELQHPLWNGVVKLKFSRNNPKSMALKQCIDRVLHVDAPKRNEWRAEQAGGEPDHARYYVARHHYTEELLQQFMHDRRAWDWNEPLSAPDARRLLYSVDPADAYEGNEDGDIGADVRYLQSPNVPKEQVRELLRGLKTDQQQRQVQKPPNSSPTNGTAATASSHTQSTLSTDVTNQLRAFEGIDEPSSSGGVSGAPAPPVSAHQNEVIAQKDQTIMRLSEELNSCQEQLTMVTSMVQQLKSQMDLTAQQQQQQQPPLQQQRPPVHTNARPPNNPSNNKNRNNRRKGYNEDLSEEEWSQRNTPNHPQDDDSDEDVDDETWSENRAQQSDGDETISTFHVNYNGNRSSHSRHGSRHSVRRSSVHSRRSTVRRDSVHSRRDAVSGHSRRDSVRSRRSIRGGGNADDAASVHSRQSLQSVSPSIKSLPREIQLMDEDDEEDERRKSRGGHPHHPHGHGGPDDDYSFFDDSYRRPPPDDDARSVGSRSAASRHSRRKLGRNSRVGRGNAGPPPPHQYNNGNYGGGSYNGSNNANYGGGSYNGSSSNHSSNYPPYGGNNNSGGGYNGPPAPPGGYNAAPNSTGPPYPPQHSKFNVANRFGNGTGVSSSGGGGGYDRGRNNGPPSGPPVPNVPREIDLSGDELEDETYANVSNDTKYVTEKNIVDPYGEKGVYTGALSKSTGMPNGKGRLEYEKEGRWYEGDWIHGRWTGVGRLSNGDGDFYEGGLKNDHKHGTGVMKFADGRVFEGEYIRGQMIQGQMTYQDGSIYGGSWVDGMRHGRGKCVFVDGSEYEGEFREGNFHGHGKMTWNDGGWYVGEWCDGEMHGKGKEIRPDGSLRHDGDWSGGQPIRSPNDSQQSRRRQRAQQPTIGEGGAGAEQ